MPACVSITQQTNFDPHLRERLTPIRGRSFFMQARQGIPIQSSFVCCCASPESVSSTEEEAQRAAAQQKARKLSGQPGLMH